MVSKKDTNDKRLRRHRRVRAKINGTPERPRLNVFRSAQHIYAQIIDDVNKKTIASASTTSKEFKNYGGNKEAAKLIGLQIAKLGQEKGVKIVVFDRGGYVYHGRIKELAEGAREGGLQF